MDLSIFGSSLKTMMSELQKKVLGNKRMLLTTGSVIFEFIAITEAIKNADTIRNIVADTKYQLDCAEADERDERTDIYKEAFKKLARPVGRIALPALASTTCIIVNHIDTKRELAEYAAQLAIINGAVNDYKQFEQKAREELGEDKYKKIKEEVEHDRVVTNYCAISGPRLGEQLCLIADFGMIISTTKDRIDLAFDRVNAVLKDNGRTMSGYHSEDFDGNQIVTYEDLFREMKVIDIPEESRFCTRYGWSAGDVDEIRYRIGWGGTETGVSYMVLYIDTEPKRL